MAVRRAIVAGALVIGALVLILAASADAAPVAFDSPPFVPSEQEEPPGFDAFVSPIEPAVYGGLQAPQVQAQPQKQAQEPVAVVGADVWAAWEHWKDVLRARGYRID